MLASFYARRMVKKVVQRGARGDEEVASCLRTGARFTTCRIRHVTLVNAAEKVRRLCLVSAQCLTKLADFFNILLDSIGRQIVRDR
jgi:hypothetical protein